MMADAKNNLYDIVVVWNTDRLNRHMLNAFVMLADLFKIGKDLRSATQQDLNDPDNPMRMIMYALHTWKDEEVSNGISTNVRRGQGEKAGKCHPLGQLRFGWDIAGAYIDGHGKYHSGDHCILSHTLRLCQSSGLIIIPSRSPILRKTSSHPMEFAKRQALDTRMSSLL